MYSLYMIFINVNTQIFCTRSNEEIHYITAAYEARFGKSLEKTIQSEVSGDYKRLLTLLLNVMCHPDSKINNSIIPLKTEIRLCGTGTACVWMDN